MISSYTEGPLQQDGRRYVKETHIDDNGTVYEYEWLGSQDAQPVVDARAVKLIELLHVEAQAQAFVADTKLPLTKLKFERLFSDAEWAAAQVFNATFEANEYLSDAQKLAIKRGLNDYRIAVDVSLTDPGTIAIVTLYEAFGVIAHGRAAEVLNG